MARNRGLSVVVALLASSWVGLARSAPGGGDATLNSLGMRMVLVPAGSFQMGSPTGEPQRQEEEHPRRVQLTRTFRIASTEVTVKQWRALMASPQTPGASDDLPVASVSWKEAQEFCQKLSEKEGVTYRLPTEAEWEYACRAGAGGPPAGREVLDGAAWYADNSDGSTHPVGRKQPNAWALHDMLGNVAEWTQDAYGPYPRIGEEKDPRGPLAGTSKVVRGGSWRGLRPALRCAARTSTPESYQLPHVGLRVVMEVR
ncbi:MAG TPA: formylglycine-generating enzyme family protein [Vicinamibacteria bacterium]